MGCGSGQQKMAAAPAAPQQEAAAAAPEETTREEGQARATDNSPPAWPADAARPEDVASIDAIMAAVYSTISGPSSQPRDWDRFRGLFAPGARLIPTGSSPDGGRLRALTVDGYIEGFKGVLEREPQGFFEVEVARRVERFDRIAHVFTTYEARKTPDGEPFMKGINSVQLFFDDTRWWVVTIYWAAERPGVEIPDEYRRGPGAG